MRRSLHLLAAVLALGLPSAAAAAVPRDVRPLAAWLEGQIGPVTERGTVRAAAAAAPLRLVRSFDIPSHDPAYARLANLSFTSDNALAALAFTDLREHDVARELLDQLAALQARDGSLAFSFDVRSGAPAGRIRSNALAWTGIAAVAYRRRTGSDRYDALIAGLADYLLKSRRPDGLVLGGPDVQWVSTQHNLLMTEFLRTAALAFGDRPVGRGLTGADLGRASEQAADAIIAKLLKKAPFNGYQGIGWFFVQGIGDDDVPLDAQVLGSMFLRQRGGGFENPWGFVSSTIIDHLYVAPRTVDGRRWSGYRPYWGEGSPDIVWSEGTAQVAWALHRQRLPAPIRDQVDPAIADIMATTKGGAAGPLGASHAVDSRRWGEFAAWPASAPASWLLIDAGGGDILYERVGSGD